MHSCLLVPVGLALLSATFALQHVIAAQKSLSAQQVHFEALKKSVLVQQRLLRSSIG